MNTLQNRWTAREASEFLRFARAGFGNRDIAEKLGRSVRAIEHRCVKMGIRRRLPRLKARPVAEPVPPPTLTIAHADLPAHYALGWRVDWHEAGQVGLVWPHASAPMVVPA